MMARYIPALSFKWLTLLYDPVLKWVMREERFKRHLRVLKPNGQLYVLDFSAPYSSLSRFVALYMHSLEEAADNFAGLIPKFITETGFQSVKEMEHSLTIFGPLSLWYASKE